MCTLLPVRSLLFEACASGQVLAFGLQVHAGSQYCIPWLCRYGPCEASALKERMKRAVALLGEQEVHAILEEQGKIEVSNYLHMAGSGFQSSPGHCWHHEGLLLGSEASSKYVR